MLCIAFAAMRDFVSRQCAGTMSLQCSHMQAPLALNLCVETCKRQDLRAPIVGAGHISKRPRTLSTLCNYFQPIPTLNLAQEIA
jgi:hypothetical protein